LQVRFLHGAHLNANDLQPIYPKMKKVCLALACHFWAKRHKGTLTLGRELYRLG
jgi:hypothetical protein